MKHIKDINEFLSEAISMKMYKENIPRDYKYDKSEGYKKWDKLFGVSVNRITIPLKSNSLDIPTSTPFMEEINEIFIPLGYKINSFEDYLNNKVYKIGDTKNPMKIGSLLRKGEDKYIFYRFDSSTERKEWKEKINNFDKDLKIIISRHPYDLLGMSSGRGWRLSSCMRIGSRRDKVYVDILASMGHKIEDDTKLGDEDYEGYTDNDVESDGLNSGYISKDIEQGTLVAYVVKSDDDNINKPLSRILIKPYFNEKNPTDIVWISADKLYGQSIEGFKSSVDEWLGSWQGEKYGFYCIKDGMYDDGKRKVILTKPISEWTEDDKLEFLDKVCFGRHRWTLNDKGEIDVVGNVYMDTMNLTEIPVKFGRINGDFNCSNNKLTTLKNCPNIVKGSFSCYVNKLINLNYAPFEVDSMFLCQHNKLTSLVGSPNIVWIFDCSGNDLTSLEGSPTIIDGDFNCKDNMLVSLEGIPKVIKRNFNGIFQGNGVILNSTEIKKLSQVGGSVYT
jgi:hypothetical protein